jgi:cysteine desulfurase/selenocysteine lyase
MIIESMQSYFSWSEYENALIDVLSVYKSENLESPIHASNSFDVEALRNDFPILATKVHGKPLIWLDNAATTQKPKAVIDRLSYFYEHENSNIHRGAHTLAAMATDAYEAARDKIKHFINASSDEIIFVRGATEGINLVAASYGRHNLKKDDEILVSCLEHHANIVPWQMLCAETGAVLRIIPVDETGQIDMQSYKNLLSSKVKIVATAYVSNSLGTITPIKEIVAMAHQYGVKVLVDAAQAVPHFKVDVNDLDCDFLVFSGHKLFGPTGIGVLFGKKDILNEMPPYQGGGNMIDDVTFEESTYQLTPRRFEAGTSDIAGAVGLGAAVDYLVHIGIDNIAEYEHSLFSYTCEALRNVPGLSIIGTASEKAGAISFTLNGIATESIGQMLDKEGIAVRTGHHCSLPILRRFGIESTARISLAFYNTYREIDVLVDTLWKLVTKTYA